MSITEKKSVLITDLRTEAARDAKAYLAESGYDVLTVPEGIALWDEEALSSFASGIADNLIGVIHPAPPVTMSGIMDITPEMWEQCSNEGAIAAMIVTKVFGELFKENGGGSIIYLNSIHAEKPMGKGYLYSLNCGAVEMLTKEAYIDYAPFGVRIFFVESGPVEGDEKVRLNDKSPIYLAVDLRYPALKTPKPDYLNGLLAFLLTDAAYPLAGTPIQADSAYIGYLNDRHKVEGRRYAD